MITIIAAVGKNNELGKDNDLIWSLPADLKFFKEKTLNHSIVMGLNTYNSIGRCLPKRRNIVLSDKTVQLDNEVVVYNDINELISKELQNNNENFIIGGASLYNYFYPLADKMYLTLIEESCFKADVYFPNINNKDWKTTLIDENEENKIKYKHVLYERIKYENK